MTFTTRGEELISSSSPSASRCSRRYHVFLSFRGEDTRRTFSNYLYKALNEAGFRTFWDDDEIQRGERIKVKLRRAIGKSRVSIVVISRNYASSSWCLDELVMILGRRRRRDSDHVVLPVFYDVDPSEVRKQKGFKFKERKGEAAKKWKKRWTKALEEVAGLAGMRFPKDRNESDFIEEIVKEVERQLAQPRVSYPNGLDSLTKSIYLRLQGGGVDSRFIAICGMGGINKTTGAQFVYNSNFSIFEGNLSRREEEIRNFDEWIVKIKANSFERALIILDYVDKREQLDAVLKMKDWLPPGNKLFITTRQKLLRAHECQKVHKLKELDHNKSLQDASGQSHPIDGYWVDSERPVDYCRGLLLAVKILGSSQSHKSLDVWKTQLQKLKAILDNEIFEKLKLSYDSLQDDGDKNLFLDIACFFVGVDQDTTITILEGCDYFPLVGIRNLIDRNMLTVDEDNKLVMPQLIQDNRPGRGCLIHIPMKFDYVPRQVLEGGIPRVHLPTEVIEESARKWMTTLVGYFLEKRLTFPVVKSTAVEFWKHRGLNEVAINNSGVYFFHFGTRDQMMGVFIEGPRYFGDHPILLRWWEPNMLLSQDSHTSVPLWVKIFNVPLEGWTIPGLSYIAGGLGRPIHVILNTEDETIVGNARVCVEIHVSSPFPKFIELYQGLDKFTNKPKFAKILVEYELVPFVCTHCHVFGHPLSQCPRQPYQVQGDKNNASVHKPILEKVNAEGNNNRGPQAIEKNKGEDVESIQRTEVGESSNCANKKVGLLMANRVCSLMQEDMDIPSPRELIFPIGGSLEAIGMDLQKTGKRGRVADDASESKRTDSSGSGSILVKSKSQLKKEKKKKHTIEKANKASKSSDPVIKDPA